MSEKFNKDGSVNKVYTRKLWNHVTDTAIDCFNEDIGEDELLGRIKEFHKMLNDLVSENE